MTRPVRKSSETALHNHAHRLAAESQHCVAWSAREDVMEATNILIDDTRNHFGLIGSEETRCEMHGYEVTMEGRIVLPEMRPSIKR